MGKLLRRLRYWLHSREMDAELAEEITQEVFLLLIRSPRRYDATRQSSLQAYLCGVARNHLRKH